MNTYRIVNIERLYCKNPVALLAKLMEFSYDYKTFVTYGENDTFDPGNLHHFRVINIRRHGREYLGFINSYRIVL